MKFAVIGPVYPYRGGISHHNSSLILAMQTLGHEVLSISYKRQYPKFLYPGKSDKDPSLEKMSVGALFILDPINPFSWKKTVNEILKFNPEKVVFHWWSSFWAPMDYFLLNALLKNKVNTVCIVHNVFPHEKRFFDEFLSKLILKKFTRLVVHSKGEQEKILKLGIKTEAGYIPHPVYDTLSSTGKIDKIEAKKMLGLPLDKTVLLMFGIVRKYKGLSVLLDSIKELVENDFTKIHLLVAGEFWEAEDRYRRKIKGLNIDEFVSIQNRYIPNDEIPILFSAADLFVAPYIGGTQSGAIKLAMAYDLPIISTEIVADEMNGSSDWVKVPPNNPSRFAVAIKNCQPYLLTPSSTNTTWLDLAKFVGLLE
jgi:glycosyltransferase involved in cell wall biosynthesis